MPCWTERKTTVDLSAVGRIDPGLLQQALNEIGLNAVRQGDVIRFNGGEYNVRTGAMSAYSASATKINENIKQAYGAQVVKATAKRYGWQLKETAKFQYEIAKR